MALSRRSLIGLIALSFGSALAFAQTRPAPSGGGGFDPNKKPAAMVKVMAISDTLPAEGLFYLKNAKEGRALALPKGRFSAPMPLFSQGQPMVFGVKGPQVEGAPSYRPLVQAILPEGGVEEVAVFLAASGEGADMRLSALALDNGLKVFPPRSIRVLNFTGEKLFAQLDTFRGELPPGPANAMPYPEIKTEPGRTGRFRVGIGRMDTTGNPQILFSGWADAWPNARTLLLITPPKSGSDKPEVKFVVDNLPPPPKPPGPPH